MKYVLITAVRDEEATIGETLESMMNQTRPPAEWVVVSDGSIDRTDELVLEASRRCPWIKLVQLPHRPGRSFAAMVNAINTGRDRLTVSDYDLIGLLDGDLRFEPDYFARVVAEFEKSPKLGLAGGHVVDIGDDPTVMPHNRLDVPGAVQLFRRACYEEINGYLVIPEGGFDAVACAHVRMLGYESRLLTDLIVDHLKPRNISAGNPLRRKWQQGVRDCAVGYHPLFETVKCIGRISESPYVFGSIAWLWGYFGRALQRRPRVVPEDVVAYIRREQLKRLRLSR